MMVRYFCCLLTATLRTQCTWFERNNHYLDICLVRLIYFMICLYMTTTNTAQLFDILIQYGFTTNEANIYLMLVQYGSGTGGNIARITGINRATVYTVLAQMKKSWRVYELTQNDVTIFYPVDYKTLFASLEQKYSAFKESLDDFWSLKSSSFFKEYEPVFFSGIDWIQKAFELTLKSKTPIYSFIDYATYYNNELLVKRAKDYYLPQRIKHNIKAYCISDYSEENCLYQSEDNKVK